MSTSDSRREISSQSALKCGKFWKTDRTLSAQHLDHL